MLALTARTAGAANISANARDALGRGGIHKRHFLLFFFFALFWRKKKNQ